MFLLVFSTCPFAFAETNLDIKLICENISNETIENWGSGWKLKQQTMFEYKDLSIVLERDRCFPEASNTNIGNRFSLLETDDYFKCVFQNITGDQENNQEITINRYSGATSWTINAGTFKSGVQIDGYKITNNFRCLKRKKLF